MMTVPPELAHFVREHVYLIPLLPAIGAAVLGIAWMLGQKLEKQLVSWIACGTVAGSLVLSVLAFLILQAIKDPAARHFTNALWTWFSLGKLEVPFAFLLDPLSAVMILVVTGIGFLIHVYSTAYMGEDEAYQKFMSFLNLFMAAMLVLVLGNNFLMMFIGWEGVGLCSYLLIGFWYKEIPNANAAKKAFVVNRVGDFAFVAGIMVLVWVTGQETGFYSVVFREMAGHVAEYAKVEQVPFFALPLLGTMGPITLATLLFFGGATGKSAQIPLYTWLPDAMAGPTPVSALIHAATMVTAGVYMITRLNFLFSLAPFTLVVVAGVGALTAVVAATIGLFQYDIKKVLAYSTVSQLGFMFLGLGAAAYTAGMFHVFTHAFFKACLFLGAGSVIHSLHHSLPHGVDAQDMRHMGGMRKFMPVTFLTFVAAWIAIAGIPPFAGFWSKDEILWKTFERFYFDEPFGKAYLVFYLMGLAGAAMTAFYMTRLVAMTFFGEYRGKKAGDAYLAAHAAHGHGDHGHDDHSHASHEPRESPFAITFPLTALAVGSVIAGIWLGPAAWTGVHENKWNRWLAPVVAHGAAAHASTTTPDETGLLAQAGHGGGRGSTDAAHGSAPAAKPAEHAAAGSQKHAPWALEFGLALFSALWAAAFVGMGLFAYWKRPEIPAKALAQYGPGGTFSGSPRGVAYRWIYNKYYVDELYERVFVQGSKNLAWFSGKFDALVVDGIVNGIGYAVIIIRWAVGLFDRVIVDGLFIEKLTAGLVDVGGRVIRKAETGDLQVYLRWIAYGAIATTGTYFLIVLTRTQG